MKKLDIILDFDNTLASCIEHAVDFAAEKFNADIRFDMVQGWHMEGLPKHIGEYMLSILDTEELMKKQKPLPGSQDFVRELNKRGHKVMVFSSVSPNAMQTRANQIMEHFEVDPRNITLGGNKSAMCGDILIDDCLDTVEKSMCRHPILFQQPWNKTDKDILIVKNYEEAIALVDKIANT